MVVQIFAGMFIGAVLTSIVWGLNLKGSKKKAEKELRAREELMHELGGYWVDIDSLISSFRAGMMDERTFKNSFSVKIDAINHTLKPNMHLFEVYYVKYNETLIKEYTQIVHQKEIPSDISSVADFSREMETAYTSTVPEQTDLFIPGAGVIPKKSQPAKSQPHSVKVEQAAAVSEQIVEDPEKKPVVCTDTTIAEPLRGSSKEEGSADDGPEPEPTQLITNTPPQSASEVSDEVDAMFEEAFSVIEGQDEPQDTEQNRETALESTATAVGQQLPESEVSLTDKTVLDIDLNIEKSDETAESDPDDTPDEEPAKSTAHQSLFNQLSSETSGMEEDFSMETLIDVDVSTIAAHLEGKSRDQMPKDESPDKTRLFEVENERDNEILTDKTELEVVIASDAAHTEFEEDDSIPEETTYTRSETITGNSSDASASGEVESADDDFEVIIPDSSVVEESLPLESVSEVNDEESLQDAVEEVAITGDDIADKIASLESSTESKKTVSAESSGAKKSNETAPEDSKKSKPADPVQPSLKEREEAITGDDVAGQIDSFFGLFK